MSKRYNNLYEKIIDIDNIKLAHQHARKDKGLYSAVQKTDKNLEERAKAIQKMLKNHTYKVSKYNISVLKDKTKERILYKLPYYPDRIIQWAIMLQLSPIFEKTFTNFTCASLPGRGIHYASNLLNKYLNTNIEETQYCLKIDIQKFYPNINHEILKSLLRKKFKDKDLLIELDKIIDSMKTISLDGLNISSELKQKSFIPNRGVPIGSYLSQYFANFYLTYFDHWLKEEQKCRYVVRYMDDIVILSSSKEYLHQLLQNIKHYLKENLELEIKTNYQIFPVDSRGIDFVGYRHFHGYKLLRKSTLKDCKKVIKDCNHAPSLLSNQLWSAYNSYEGWLLWCDSNRIYQKYFNPLVPKVNTYYFIYKKSKHKRANYSYKISNNFKKKKKFYMNNNIYHKKIHERSISYYDS